MDDKPKDVIRETDAEAIRLAKTLMRTARFGALAVIESGTGAPLASRVGVATDADGTPLILVSSTVGAHQGDPCRSALFAARRRAWQGRSPRPSAHHAGLPRDEA